MTGNILGNFRGKLSDFITKGSNYLNMSKIDFLQNSPYSLEDIVTTFEEINYFFHPSLEERIIKKGGCSNFWEYVQKVSDRGFILLHYNTFEIEGVSIFYANDNEEFKAYIPVFFVRKNYSGKGVGNTLLKTSLKKISERGMKVVRVQTWKSNLNAFSLYEKNGFIKISEVGADVLLELRIQQKI